MNLKLNLDQLLSSETGLLKLIHLFLLTVLQNAPGTVITASQVNGNVVNHVTSTESSSLDKLSDSYYGTNSSILDQQSNSPVFKYHCSPWINQRIWYKIHSKPKITCSSNGCRYPGSSVSSPTSHAENDKRLNNFTDNDQQSDTIILNESKLFHFSSLLSSSTNHSSWPTHPLPRRTSDNLSPSVCSYTGLDSLNYSNDTNSPISSNLDWMQDYLHLMRSYSKGECLLFDNSSIVSVCSSKPIQRIEKLKSYNFGHCDRYPLANVLSDDAWSKVIGSNESLCVSVLQELNLLDSLANDIYCHFEELLSRYNCESYSIKNTCTACKKAYKEWVCSMILPFYFDGIYIKPCRSFCEKVEQKCPHLHPAVTYAGEPVFICIDPNIPYFRNSSNIPYGSPGQCYQSCHLANEIDFYSDSGEKITCLSYEKLLANVLRKTLSEEMIDWLSKEDRTSSSSSSMESDYSEPSETNLTEPIIEFDAISEAYHIKVNETEDGVNIANSGNSNHNKESSVNSGNSVVNGHPRLNVANFAVNGLVVNNHVKRSKDKQLSETTDSVTTDPGSLKVSGDEDSHQFPSMSLPLDDDGSEDEGEREDDSISTTSASSSSSTTSTANSFSVQATLTNAEVHLTLSSAYHFSLLILILGYFR